MKTVKILIALVALALTTQSCVSNKKYAELMSEKDALAQSLSDTQNKLKMLEEEKANMAASMDDLTSKYNMSQKDLDAAKSALDEAKKSSDMSSKELGMMKDAIAKALKYYEKAGLSVEINDDRMYLTNAQPILFRSGSVRLSKDGRDFLKTMAETLKSNPDLVMMIEGHTDNRSISTGRFADNWDLSVIRATSVVRELVKNGVDPAQLTAAGRGEHAPKNDAEDQTAETRKDNRRTEFIVLPRLSAMSDILNKP